MKQNNSLTKTVVICISAAIVVLAVIVVLLMFRNLLNQSTPEPLKSYTVSIEKDSDKTSDEAPGTLVFTDEEGKSLDVDGEDYMSDLAQDRFIIVKGRELVYFENDQMVPLTQNCISCTISNNGLIVGYIEPNSSEKLYEGTLYTYNTVTDKITKICENCFVSTTGRIQISPSGDVVAYTKNYDLEARTYDCCYYKKGKETIIGQNRDIVAISDNADYIYYAIEDPENYTSILAVYTEKNGEVILDETSSLEMYLNRDYSESVFYKGTDKNTLYITRQGSEPSVYTDNPKGFDTSSLVPHVNAVLDVDTF